MSEFQCSGLFALSLSTLCKENIMCYYFVTVKKALLYISGSHHYKAIKSSSCTIKGQIRVTKDLLQVVHAADAAAVLEFLVFLFFFLGVSCSYIQILL